MRLHVIFFGWLGVCVFSARRAALASMSIVCVFDQIGLNLQLKTQQKLFFAKLSSSRLALVKLNWVCLNIIVTPTHRNASFRHTQGQSKQFQ